MSKPSANQDRLRPRPAIVSMEPYRPPSSGRQKKMRLDFNENTVGCSPRVLQRLKKIVAQDLAVYPEYEQALAKFTAYFQVERDQMTLTNGTDEAIQLVVNTYVSDGDTVVVLRPTYAMYRFYSQVAGARIVEVDYLADLRFPEAKLLRAVNARTKLIFVANPNNPTGTSASPDQLRGIIESAPKAAVMVDEAYFEFFGQTALPWIENYPNLFVSRTFSKAFGLAAFRLGCLFSQAGNIEKIRKAQSPYSVNTPAVLCALEAIQDVGFVKKYVSEVLRARQMLCQELNRLGWEFFPSSANFVLVDFGPAAEAMRRALGEHEILVRDRSYELPGCVRITVGTVAQTRELIGVLRRLSEGRKSILHIGANGTPRDGDTKRSS